MLFKMVQNTNRFPGKGAYLDQKTINLIQNVVKGSKHPIDSCL